MGNNNHFSRLNRFAIRPQLNFGFYNNDPGRKFNQIFNFDSEINKSFPNIIDWVFAIHFRRFWCWHRSEHTLYIKARLFHLIHFPPSLLSPSIPVATQIERGFSTLLLTSQHHRAQNCHSQLNFSKAFQCQRLCFLRNQSWFIYLTWNFVTKVLAATLKDSGRR